MKSIQDQYEKTAEWKAVRQRVLDKVIILPSGDQDDTYAKYIKPNWPEIDYRQMGRGPDYSYIAPLRTTPENALYLSASWMHDNVTSSGPFGEYYRVWGDGKQMVKGDIFDYFGFSGLTADELKRMGYIVWMPVQQKGSWLGEGDNLTFMNMLGNGLRAYDHGSFGGWGGLQVMPGVGMSVPSEDKTAAPFPNFFPAAQRDFAARLKWSITPRYQDANHEPQVKIDGPLSLNARPGQRLTLKGMVSDPDGNSVAVQWWQFKMETVESDVKFVRPRSAISEIIVPRDAKPGQMFHCILEVTDNTPAPLSRYQRIVISVQP